MMSPSKIPPGGIHHGLLLQAAGILYEEKDAEQHPSEVAALGLTLAPTLVVWDEQPTLYAGVERIREFLQAAAP